MRSFQSIQRIVVKVGSSTITHSNGIINLAKIDRLAWELSNLKNNGIEVVLVSSGSIAAGKKRLQLPNGPVTTALKQAASSVGQVALMHTYNKAFAEYGYMASQILLTKKIETDTEMYTNSVVTFNELLHMNVIPVVNENDTISTYEIKFGDNDTLSAVVARIISADLLVLLSDVQGLYDDDPNTNPDAKLFHQIQRIDPKLLGFAKETNSNVGTGGMITKLRACNMCMEKGIDAIIASGEDMRILRQIIQGENIGTLFRKEEHDIRNL